METAKSVVSAARSTGYSHREMAGAVQSLFASFSPPLDRLIKRGDKVLVKPYLTHMGSSDPAKRMVSHPAFVRAVIEAMQDCGGRVSFGDVGLQARDAAVPRDKAWLYELARDTGAKPVSFARAGASPIKSGLVYPRRLYVSNAALEADVVVSCANAVPQDEMLFTGAVKNMFNVLAGGQQSLLYGLFRTPGELARAIVSAYLAVRPAINLLDMTLVREPGKHGTDRAVGLLLGSQDAMALDRIAIEVLGYGAHDLLTSRVGAELGLGQADSGKVAIAGVDIAAHGQSEFPLPRRWLGEAKTPLPTLAKRIVSHAGFSQRPAIAASNCTGCDDCIEVCPVGAIDYRGKTTPSIDPAACINCGYCAKVCTSYAVRSEYVGIARLWNRAKAGGSVGLGPMRLHLRVSRNQPIGKPVRGAADAGLETATAVRATEAPAE